MDGDVYTRHRLASSMRLMRRIRAGGSWIEDMRCDRWFSYSGRRSVFLCFLYFSLLQHVLIRGRQLKHFPTDFPSALLRYLPLFVQSKGFKGRRRLVGVIGT